MPQSIDFINPYKIGGANIIKRLVWDLNIQSWKSRAYLSEVKDKYEGKKAVILCNGPSLLKTDFSILNETFTFGLNKINILFDKTDFRPSCIVAVNPYVLDQNKEYFNTTDLPLYLDSKALSIIKPRSNITYLHSCDHMKFVRDCSFSISQAYTVTYVALQLAFHLGFKAVALVGCDHNFVTKGKPNSLVTSTEDDKNHFDPNYFGKGAKWHLPDLDHSEASYIFAKSAFSEDNRVVYNSTQGGLLEVFPRIPLKEFIESI